MNFTSIKLNPMQIYSDKDIERKKIESLREWAYAEERPMSYNRKERKGRKIMAQKFEAEFQRREALKKQEPDPNDITDIVPILEGKPTRKHDEIDKKIRSWLDDDELDF